MKIIKKEFIEDNRNYYDLSIAETHNFVLADGQVVHNTGVGYSVQNHHIEKLPEIRKPNPKKFKRFLIGDSIEGWADSIKVLMKSYFNGGSSINFDYGDIRRKGARLITAGGKAPGPDPLRECHLKITHILNQKEDGDQLTSLEVHDIMCHLADAVLAGGIRRAAMISLFDADDLDMISCKSGNWWELNPQRGRANNSAVLLRNKITEEYFMDLWKRIENSRAGEPGIFLTNDKDWGTNPCFTGDTMVAVADGRNAVSIKELADTSNGVIKFPVYSGKASTYGNQFGSTYKFNKWKPEIQNAVAFKSGTKPTVEVLLSNGDRFRCTDNHRLALPNGEYVEAKDSVGLELESFFTYNDNSSGKKYRHINSFTNGYAKQHRMIYEFTNGSIPSGYVIDHIENNFNDNISNLQLLTKEEHDVKSGSERLGLNNGIHKIKDNPNFRHNLSLNATLNSNSNSNGLSNIELIEIGKRVVSNGDKLTINNCIKINSKFPKTFSKNRFNGSFGYFKDVVNGVVEYVEPTLPEYSNWKNNKKIDLTSKENLRVIEVEYTGEIEDVYDLTVDNNSNFYILTSGDDGFINSRGVLVHNCCEIALRPFQFCNLCEVNVSDIVSQEDLNERVKAAAFLGTMQAGYTDFHYLRPIWKKTTEKEALIGVGLTGIGSGEYKKYDLRVAAETVKKENERVADLIGINRAARTTTLKPSGTSSLVAGTSSGVHAWHNDYYIRRIRVNKNEAIYTYLSIYHPELIKDEYYAPHRTAVIEIPVKAPENAIYRTESPIETLERVKYIHKDWIKPGHRKGQNTHNVSATISIKDDEWETVGEWMWNNRNSYTGISVLPYDGGSYIQAPFEDITKEQYEEMVQSLHNIDLTKVIEMSDETDLAGELACSGGACEIV